VFNEASSAPNVLQYHVVVDGAVCSGDLSGAVETAQGGALTVSGSTVTDANSSVANVLSSIDAGNGVVYLIDAVLLPTPSAVGDGAGASSPVAHLSSCQNFDPGAPPWLSAWHPRTQVDALASFHAGTLFFEGTSGGVSVVGAPHFVPRPGRKKRQGAADATGPARNAGTEPSVRETTACDDDCSEYDSSQCPDFIDSEDELNEALSACRLG
jgi:hypothetical protein